MIELQKLIYFTTIVDNNFSLSNASKSLSITQPTLSLTIEQLENYFDNKLLEKEKNKFVRLTSAGKILYDDAKKMIEQENETYLKLTHLNDFIGELKIAIPPVTQPIVCARVIPEFKKRYPNIKLSIFEEGAFVGKNRIEQGEIDFGFLTSFQNSDTIEGFQIYESDIVAIFKNDHPLSTKDKVTTSDVGQYDIVGLDETFTLYRILDTYFNFHNSAIHYFHLTSRWDYAAEIVATSKYNFITILPRPILRLYQNSSITYRCFEDEFKWKVELSYRKNRVLRKECLLFIAFVKEYFNIK